MIGSVLGVGGAAGFAYYRLTTEPDRPERVEPPADVPAPPPGKTKWAGVNVLMPRLQSAASSSGVPLGLLVGWIGEESGGKITSYTSLDERGFFQLMPIESKTIGVDHKRLSTDPQYSIDAGMLLIQDYIKSTKKLGVAPEGSSYFWRLVKLGHSMGKGQTKKVVEAAKKAGKAGSWPELEQFALNMRVLGPQPKKWFPFVDKIYEIGRPFGFGAEVAGGTLVGEDICGLDLFGTV